MEAPDGSPPEELHDTLIWLFKGHGIAAQAAGAWVTFPNHSGKIQGLIFDRKDVNPLCSTQVDIRFSPWPGCLICESFSGFADSRDERIRESLSIFAENTFHVLLRAFFGVDCGDHISVFNINNNGAPRTVIDGNICVRSTGTADMKFDWIDGFHRLLASQPMSEGTHWARLYYAQMDGHAMTLELLLDNEPWTSALAVAGSLPWPPNTGFCSYRMFVVIQGGLDIGRAVGILAQHGEAEDEQLEALLVAAGLSVIDAKRIILLAPIAFGSRILASLGIATSTVCTLDDGVTRKPLDLLESRIFKELSSIAANAQRDATFSREEFLAIAGRDASVNAVNKALHAGSNPRDLRLASFIVLWREDAPLCPTSEMASATGNQRWWRFWDRSGRTRPGS